MTSIDELFRKSGSSSSKRKEPPTNPDEIYKAAKHSVNRDVKGKEHREESEGHYEEGGVAGPQLPPDEEEEQGEDEEEGRFFGGGVTRNIKDVLDLMEEREGEEIAPEKIDLAWLRRTALTFEKRISKNAELRAKFEDDPPNFMASEADLDADIKALSILTDHSELYTEFAKLGCVKSLVSLLAHENTDIAINAIEILGELIDEDVQADQTQWDNLVKAMLEADLPDLLVQNLARLDETSESDRSGVYHSLTLVENLASQLNALDNVLDGSTILEWLFSRIQRRELPTSQNKQYAAEVLAIILQASENSRTHCIDLDAIEILLQLVSAYRKRDPPKDSNEEEFAENVFDCLTCLVEADGGKRKLLQAEGVELCLIMLKEGKFSKPRALRVLDHGMGGNDGVQVCEKVVEAAGLKPIYRSYLKSTDQATIEHLLGMLASMLRQLPGNSASRVRLLAKFVENGYGTLERLVGQRREYSEKLGPVDERIRKERKERELEDPKTLADEWLSRRLDAGLFCLQTVDFILAWLVAEDEGARQRITSLLAERDEALTDIRRTLQEQLDGLQAEKDGPDATTHIDMLRTLLEMV